MISALYHHTHVQLYIHTYIHACVHTYIYTYIHTRRRQFIKETNESLNNYSGVVIIHLKVSIVLLIIIV